MIKKTFGFCIKEIFFYFEKFPCIQLYFFNTEFV